MSYRPVICVTGTPCRHGRHSIRLLDDEKWYCLDGANWTAACPDSPTKLHEPVDAVTVEWVDDEPDPE